MCNAVSRYFLLLIVFTSATPGLFADDLASIRELLTKADKAEGDKRLDDLMQCFATSFTVSLTVGGETIVGVDAIWSQFQQSFDTDRIIEKLGIRTTSSEPKRTVRIIDRDTSIVNATHVETFTVDTTRFSVNCARLTVVKRTTEGWVILHVSGTANHEQSEDLVDAVKTMVANKKTRSSGSDKEARSSREQQSAASRANELVHQNKSKLLDQTFDILKENSKALGLETIDD